ncbi:signal peptidase II [Spirochaetia bacterium 38H-sp]|uniref:Lipoprotein signal peptidase n=1 Tax=Rarispira pelagica TaxID=3141764 RepID=A0ABU9U8H3_9SPIR
MKDRIKTLLPFSLTLVVFAIDQIVKSLVVRTIPYHKVGFSIGGDLIRIIHTGNKNGAFSIGWHLPDIVNIIIFWVLSTVFLTVLIIYLIKRPNDFTIYQRWLIAGIIGGGLGNQFDRFFRPNGVVDFIDVKFFGILGLERWPTFNIADASVVICVGLLIISLFLSDKKKESINE